MAEFHPNILYYDYHWDYPKLERGKGVYLYDAQGNRYIDGAGGAVSVSLAHGREDMARTLYEQAKRMAYIHRDVATAKIAERACAHLHRCLGMDRFFLVSGGSEATEICGKIARLHFVDRGKPSKRMIIGRWMSYHGYTGNSLAYGGNPGRRRDYGCELYNDFKIPPAYCYRCWYGRQPGSCGCECARALEEEILMRGPENVAGFIFEPVSGTSLGAAYAPERYYRTIRAVCDKYDVLMIADEVMCGSGRTGTWNAMNHFGIKPDIMAVAKSISGGYFPVGAACCTEKVAAPIVAKGEFGPGFTWSGSPLAAAVVDKTLSVIEEENLLPNVEKQGKALREGLEGLKAGHPCVGDVRGLGLMIGIEFVKDAATKECFPRELEFGKKVEECCLTHRLLTLGCARFNKGVGGDGIMLGPNFEVTAEEIGEIVSAMDAALTDAERGTV